MKVQFVNEEKKEYKIFSGLIFDACIESKSGKPFWVWMNYKDRQFDCNYPYFKENFKVCEE